MSWKILDPALDNWAVARQTRPVRVGRLGPGFGVRDAAPDRPRMAAAVTSACARSQRTMIVDLPDTTTNEVNKKLDRAARRGRRGHHGPGADPGHRTGYRSAAGGFDRGRQLRQPRASLPGDRGQSRRPAGRAKPRLDAQIRVGRDAGAGEVVVLRLSGPLAKHASSVVMPFLLPDTPVVAWWPDIAPEVPAQDPLGQLAIRRITDATNGVDPLACDQEPAGGLHRRRHRPVLEPDHLLARVADLCPGPGAARTDHVGTGVRPEIRTGTGHPGGLAGQPDRRSGTRAPSAI